MLDDAFANFKRKIQAGKIQITMFKLFDDAQSVQIVIEAAAVRAHQFVKLAFAGMAEGRVADVMHKGEGFSKLGVQPERSGNGAGNLRNLQGVRQPIAKVVGKPRSEYLRLGFEAAKSAGMNNAVAVPRVKTPVRMQRFRIAAAAGAFGTHRPWRKS